jgi:hypothetical protein
MSLHTEPQTIQITTTRNGAEASFADFKRAGRIVAADFMGALFLPDDAGALLCFRRQSNNPKHRFFAVTCDTETLQRFAEQLAAQPVTMAQ